MFSFHLFIGLTGGCFTSQNSVCITYFPVPSYMPFDCLFAGKNMKDFRLPPQCCWGHCSSGLLCSVDW